MPTYVPQGRDVEDRKKGPQNRKNRYTQQGDDGWGAGAEPWDDMPRAAYKKPPSIDGDSNWGEGAQPWTAPPSVVSDGEESESEAPRPGPAAQPLRTSEVGVDDSTPDRDDPPSDTDTATPDAKPSAPTPVSPVNFEREQFNWADEPQEELPPLGPPPGLGPSSPKSPSGWKKKNKKPWRPDPATPAPNPFTPPTNGNSKGKGKAREPQRSTSSDANQSASTSGSNSRTSSTPQSRGTPTRKDFRVTPMTYEEPKEYKSVDEWADSAWNNDTSATW